MQCNMLEAKNQLSKLVQAAQAGEEVIIANNGVPVARLVKIEPNRTTRKPGAWADLAKPAPDWDSPEFNAELAQALQAGFQP